MRAYSAPGKALLAGGYLVIDPQYSAYVTALSARMHATVALKPSAGLELTITVRSPQFADGEWCYTVLKPESKWVATELSGKTNPFLEAAVATVWNYANPNQEASDVDVTIWLDPGFHAPSDEKKVLAAGRPFYFHQQQIHEVPKTGLGSLAGLVVVVLAALMSLFVPDIDQHPNRLHNVAQVAHCAAQKKIGSGFDVAAAVFGSIQFRRFDPKLVETAVGGSITTLQDIVGQLWLFGHTKISLPPKIRLLMGDVRGGSNTPKLVSQVLKWKADQPEEALEVYTELNRANLAFVKVLMSLHTEHRLNPVDYDAAVLHVFSSAPVLPRTERMVLLFRRITLLMAAIRRWIQAMTAKSGAAIEPPEQTALLDACATLPGCFGGVVPGAGGYDAICVLVLESHVDEFKRASASDSRLSSVSWLHLEEEAAGLVVEDPGAYQFA